MEQSDCTSPQFSINCSAPAHAPASHLHHIDYHVTLGLPIKVRLSDLETLCFSVSLSIADEWQDIFEICVQSCFSVKCNSLRQLLNKHELK